MTDPREVCPDPSWKSGEGYDEYLDTLRRKGETDAEYVVRMARAWECPTCGETFANMPYISRVCANCKSEN